MCVLLLPSLANYDALRKACTPVKSWWAGITRRCPPNRSISATDDDQFIELRSKYAGIICGGIFLNDFIQTHLGMNPWPAEH